MENRCLLCGCKTDMLDLTEYEFKNGEKATVCGFCQKQLSAFNKNPKANALWAQQLLETDTKGVRTKEVEQAFKQMMSVNGIEQVFEKNYVNTVPLPPQSQYYQQMSANTAFNTQWNNMSEFSNQPLTEHEELEIVKKQLNDLQTNFNKFKKRYYLSKILGIVLPIVFIILMLIILVKSGAVQSIFDYYAQLSDWANY